MKHTARKRFGQHFLADSAVIHHIITAIAPQNTDRFVEIGPGLGALTWPLRAAMGQAHHRLRVIEIDRDLAAHWRSQGPGIEVIEADVLGVDFTALAAQSQGPLRVVGNLPYNISSPILFTLLAHAEHVVDQHVMLQKEVVERMVACPASKNYGRLSVMLQWRYDIEWLFDVSPACFRPPPRVDSSVARMLPWPNPKSIDARQLSRIVATAFSQRRKLLRHTLGAWLEQHAFGGTFDVQRRAEEVPVSEFVALAAELGPVPAPPKPPA